MLKTKIICIASVIALAGAGQASAGSMFGGHKQPARGISVVVAPSIDLGGILSGNKNNETTILGNVLNNVLGGTLSLLSGNNSGIIKSGGKNKRH
ncbi:MAG: hypothetical protein QHC90_18095 [Shinella sp.]|nr:hypothetical protein [Shinella sp.]